MDKRNIYKQIISKEIPGLTDKEIDQAIDGLLAFAKIAVESLKSSTNH